MAITGLPDPVMADTDLKLICTIIRIKPKAGGLFGINFITASQLSCGKVMFSVICVGHSVHVTTTHDGIGPSIQGPLSPYRNQYPTPAPRHVQSCSTVTLPCRKPHTVGQRAVFHSTSFVFIV